MEDKDDLGDNKPPPDPGEDPDLADIELSGDEGPGELDGSEPIDAIGDKILDRAGRSALDMMPPLPPPATPPPDVSDGRRSLDEVGPSGRRIPKGDSEEPGEIIKILKENKLAPEQIEHWGIGMKGEGKIYLSDDGEACKIDKRGVPYKVGSDGRFFLPADPLTSIHQKLGRNWARQKRKQPTKRRKETRLDLPRKKGRKPRWVRR